MSNDVCIKFVTNQKNGRTLIYNNYLYRKKKVRDDKVDYECYFKQKEYRCNARLILKNDLPYKTDVNQHNHPPPKSKIDAMLMKDKARKARAANESITEPVSKVSHSNIEELLTEEGLYNRQPSTEEGTDTENHGTYTTATARKNTKASPRQLTTASDVKATIQKLEKLIERVSRLPSTDEYDLFGQYVAATLRKLPVESAISAEERIYAVLSQERRYVVTNNVPSVD